MVRKINRRESFQYAFAGVWYTLKTQRNAQIHLAIATGIFILGVLLKLSLTEWAILALTTGLVLATEMLNTVAEAAMDYATTDFHPQVKVVKDIAAGAVLITALTSVIVGLLILGPPLFKWLTPLVIASR
ncbi:MAG TPA: diacylglycerol kinase family protein [Anaerolineae bacterium]|jgi:diacylglycerol kinase|nr:diacylglycerol kinase family protein [Anaerolineae bacterium]